MKNADEQTDTLSASIATLVAMTISQRAIGFVRQIVFCRWLSPEELGQWDLVLGFLELAAPVAVLGIPGSYGRYLEHYRQRGHLRRFLWWTGTITGLLGLSVSAAVYLGAGTVSQVVFGSAGHVELTRQVAMSLGLLITYHYVNVLLTSMRRSRAASRNEFVHCVAFAAVAIAFLLTGRQDAASILSAYAIGCGAAIIVSIGTLFVGAESSDAKPLFSASAMWIKVVPFAVWVWGTNWLANVFELADRFMLVHYSGLPASETLALVGNYHTARVFPLLLVSISGLIATVLTPYLSQDWEAGRREDVSQRLCLTLKLLAVVMLAGYSVLMLVAPWLFTAAMGGKYAGGLSVLHITVVYCSWFALARVAQKYLWCCERVPFAVAAWGVGVVANVGLNFVLIQRWGLAGVASATAFGNLISLLAIVISCRCCGMRFDRGTLLCLALPCALSGGAAAGIIVVGVLVVVSVKSSIIWNDYDRNVLRELFLTHHHRWHVKFAQWRSQRAMRLPSNSRT